MKFLSLFQSLLSKPFVHTVLAAAIGGAITSVAGSLSTGSTKGIGGVAAGGALVGVAALWTNKPTQSGLTPQDPPQS